MARNAFDLTALSKELTRHPEFKALNKLIGRCAAAHSFRLDLENVISSINYLATIAGTDAETRTFAGRALMVHSIMMYCRASIEDGNGRFRIGVTSTYNDEQKKMHQEIVNLRNTVFAHFGRPSGKYGAEWHDERLLFILDEGKIFVKSVYTGTNYLKSLIHDLEELATEALKNVSAKSDKFGLELIDAILEDDNRKKLAKIVKLHDFDPVSFFKGGVSAEQFWTNKRFVTETHQMKQRDGSDLSPPSPLIETLIELSSE